MAKPEPSNIKSEKIDGTRVVTIEASEPRARDIAERVIGRFYYFTEKRDDEAGVSRFMIGRPIPPAQRGLVRGLVH